MSNKTGVLGAVRNILFEQVPDEKPEEQPAQAPAGHQPQAPVSGYGMPAPSIDPSRAQQLDEAATQQLRTSMSACYGSYGEFLSNMEVLADVVPDEGQRMKAAMKMLGKKGVGVAKVLSDVDACLGALESENRSFRDTCQSQVEQRVGSKRKALEQIKADIAAKQNQIAAIQGEIATLQASVLSSALEIKAEEDNIAVVQERFTGVYNNMKSAIAAQRAKIAQDA